MNQERVAMITQSIHGFPIEILLDIDGKGNNDIRTGVGLFDHLLQLFSRHGKFDLKIKCEADLNVDDHHMIDEVAMNLGLAFKIALSKTQKPINRYGFFILPMDEVLVTTAVDFCSRNSFVFDATFNREKVGDMSTEMIREFWYLFSQKAEINFIIKAEYGINDHHIAEGLFKSAAKSIKLAINQI